MGTDADGRRDHDENVLRKLIVSGLVVAATLTAVPVMLGALRSQSAFAAPFSQGGLITRGWSSRQSVDAQRLRVGVPVSQTLTIENAGSLPANYTLTATVDGERQFASHLWVVATLRGMKGASKPKKGAKKQAQKSMKQRRAEKKAAAEKKFGSGY